MRQGVFYVPSRIARHWRGPCWPRVDWHDGQRGSGGGGGGFPEDDHIIGIDMDDDDPGRGGARRNQRRRTGSGGGGGRGGDSDRRQRFLRGLKLTALGLLVAGAAGLLIATGLFLYYGSDPKLPNLTKISDYRPPQMTRVLDRNGALIGSVGSPERRRVVPLSQIPKHFIEAVIAAEDPSFYKHEGIDYWAIFRSQVTNLLGGRIGPGRWGQGGSTITQQVVKQLLLSPGEDRAPQDPGADPGPPAVAPALEGRDPHHLRQPHQLRRRPLRLRGGLAALLRQVGLGHHPGRGGFPGRRSPAAREPLASQEPRVGQDPAALRAPPDGGARLHRPGHRRRGGQAAHPGPAAHPRRDRPCARGGGRRPARAGREVQRRGAAHPGRHGEDHHRSAAAEAGAREPRARAGGGRPAAGLSRSVRPPRWAASSSSIATS